MHFDKINLVLLITILVLLASIFYIKQGEDSQNSLKPNERKFEFCTNLDLFQFTGDSLTPAQKQINQILTQ